MTQHTAPALSAPGEDELLVLPAPTPTPEPDPEPPQVVTYGALLRNRNFRLIWAGEAISTFGTYFSRIAIPIYVFSLTNSYAYLGYAAFSSLVASLIFGLFAGALADRWDRRRLMIFADLANGVNMLLMLAVVLLPLAPALKLGSIFAISFCAGLLRELFLPARIALFTEVLSKDELLAANSLDQATTTTCELLSYPLAGALLFYLGPELAFGIDAATFFVSAVFAWGVRTTPAPAVASAAQHIVSQIGEGLRIASRLPLVRELVLISLIIPMNLSLLNTLQLPYTVDVLGSTREVGFPAMEGALALGMVLGMLALGRWGQGVSRPLLLSYGILGAGTSALALGLLPLAVDYFGLTGARGNSPWTPLLLLGLPIMLFGGMTNSMILASSRTLIQERTPREAIGRVASVVGVAAGSGFALGALLTGLAQGRVSLVLLIIGGVMATIGLLCRWWLPRNTQRAPRPTPATS